MAARTAAVALAAACLALAALSRADDWELSLDARLVSSNGYPGLPENGVSAVRFDRDDSGLELGRARFALNESLGENWLVHLDASAWGEPDRIPFGLTEGYLQFRPYPFNGYRLRIKAGAFYPPVSLENRAAGWESPYTLTPSAINSWLAVEVRTVGVEAQLDWLGTRSGHAFDLAATGGVFGWDEGAGAALANYGFMLTDRQTPLGGRVGAPGGIEPLEGYEPFRELDGRAGVYAGLEARYFDRLVVRVLRYDNRADPTYEDYASGAMPWETTFDSAGVRFESGDGWTAIAQGLKGQTTLIPDGFYLAWPFKAEFALLSRQLARQHTLSLRYDRFEVDTTNPEPDGAQAGHAWTAAYVFTPDEHWRFTLEWLRVTSNAYTREDILGLPALATETQVQLAVRYALGSATR
jgi:hypothetical protein